MEKKQYSKLADLLECGNLRELSKMLKIPYSSVRHIDAGSKKLGKTASGLLNFLITLLSAIPAEQRFDYLHEIFMSEIQRTASSSRDIPGGTPE